MFIFFSVLPSLWSSFSLASVQFLKEVAIQAERGKVGKASFRLIVGFHLRLAFDVAEEKEPRESRRASNHEMESSRALLGRRDE